MAGTDSTQSTTGAESAPRATPAEIEIWHRHLDILTL